MKVLTLQSTILFSGEVSTIAGQPVPASAYNDPLKHTQTVVWKTTNCTASVEVLVTLDNDPETAVWSRAELLLFNNTSGVGHKVISGNFTWIKTIVHDLSQGDVNFFEVTY